MSYSTRVIETTLMFIIYMNLLFQQKYIIKLLIGLKARIDGILKIFKYFGKSDRLPIGYQKKTTLEVET